MRRLLLLLLLFTLPAAAGLLDRQTEFLPVAEAFRLSLEDSNSQSLKLRFINAEGYYLYRHRLSFKLEPADSGVSLGKIELPPGKVHKDKYFGETEVYYAITDIQLPINNPQNKAFTLVVGYQGCADKGLCYALETARLEIPGSAKSGAASKQNNPLMSLLGVQEAGSLRSLLTFYLLGLALTFTPCVLPMLPILSGVVLRGKPGGLRGLILSLAYVLPMALCYALLGAITGLFGAQFNLPALLQSPVWLVPFAALFVVFALAMFDTFELRLPEFLRSRLDGLANRTRGGSIAGAAGLGVLSSLLVSPCVSAPLAGLLLYISGTGDALGGGLLLFMLGLGMGTPLVIFAVGAGALLPKTGPWMLGVRKVFGVMLLGVALWMLERVLPGALTLALWGTLAGGVALALGTLELGPKQPVQRALQLCGLMLLVYAVAAWSGALRGETDPLRPLGRNLPSNQPASSTDAWQSLRTKAQLEAALASAKAAGKPVLLDWYADWCISCKVIEREVLPHPEVQARLSGFLLLRFDMSESTAEQRALLDSFKLFGPPALLLFSATGEPLQDLWIIGETDPQTLVERLDQALRRG